VKRIDVARLVRDHLDDEELADILAEYDNEIDEEKRRNRDIRNSARAAAVKRKERHEPRTDKDDWNKGPRS
jgi:hypothetical protein